MQTFLKIFKNWNVNTILLIHLFSGMAWNNAGIKQRAYPRQKETKASPSTSDILVPSSHFGIQ